MDLNGAEHYLYGKEKQDTITPVGNRITKMSNLLFVSLNLAPNFENKRWFGQDMGEKLLTHFATATEP